MLLCVYYLPYIFIMLVMIHFRGGPPPQSLAIVSLTAYSLSSPVLQSFVLVHVSLVSVFSLSSRAIH
jgi:hypothetical protein